MESFLDRIMTSKKSRCYNHRRLAQRLQHYEASKYFSKPKAHQKKIIAIICSFAGEIIHYNFLNSGETITAEKYCEEIDKMH